MAVKEEEYLCIRDKQINAQGRKIEKLEARADFKEQRLEELNTNMKDIDKKLDNITENINELKLQSSKDDYNIDARVTAIESKIETLKWIVSAVGVFVTVLTFAVTYIH